MANEKRLVYSNVMLHNMCERCNIENEDCPCEPPDCFIYDVITNAPTVDAVEVVHGRWQNWHYDPCEDCYVHVCSKCGGTNERMKPYCPNCGAKMDGGNDYD